MAGGRRHGGGADSIGVAGDLGGYACSARLPMTLHNIHYAKYYPVRGAWRDTPGRAPGLPARRPRLASARRKSPAATGIPPACHPPVKIVVEYPPSGFARVP